MTPLRVTEDIVPRLARGMRLRHDQARDQWAIMAPERMFVLDDISKVIVEACDGETSVGDIVTALATRYQAPREVISKDVVELLQGFADKGVIIA